jgi:HrpA-like RNA helicase
MFITQPRRIAAKALVEWVRVSEPTLQDKFALRLGHGVREYESDLVQAWFCTTGYLVQYLANNVENFRYITHLIIDEVHERSVETDLLCLLTKRLLFIFPHLRLVLMSATIAAEMYTEYFEVPRSPIYVSARRFPIREYYLEDLDQVVSLKGEEKTLLGNILANSAKQQGSNIPMPHEIKSLHQLAVYLTIAIGKPRTSVLIFVAGMNDIIHISELIEKIKIPGKKFTCLPIHGEIPIEDQMVVFQPAGPNEVKVIVATNVAESSITLPDVDSKYR